MPTHNNKTEWADYWKEEFRLNNAAQGFPLETVSEAPDPLDLRVKGPGGSFYAVENNDHNNPLAEGAWGKASVANNTNFTVDTPCGIRSCTKTITHALALHAESKSQAGWVPGWPGGIVDRPLSDFSVINNNIGTEVDKYFDPDDPQVRINAGKQPVHLGATIRHISAHQAAIETIGKYTDAGGNLVTIYHTGYAKDDRVALKNLMESIGDAAGLAEQAGAVMEFYGDPNLYAQQRDPNDATNFLPLIAWYYDKAGWLTGLAVEEVLGDTWYNLVNTQFSILGLDMTKCFPSYDGNLTSDDGVNLRFKGHGALPVEIPGLATAYSNYHGPNGDELYLEPEQSTESGYAIGSAVMPARELAKWAHGIRYSQYLTYFGPNPRDQLFTQQTGVANDDFTQNQSWINANSSYGSPYSPSAGWPRINWGFGTYKLESATGGVSQQEIEIWGTIGNGGFSGYGASVIWLDDGTDNVILVANHNSGLANSMTYAAAKDYVENFM